MNKNLFTRNNSIQAENSIENNYAVLDAENLIIQIDGDNPPSIKEGTRFFYIDNDLLSHVIVNTDQFFNWGIGNFPTKTNDTTYYIYVASLDVDQNPIFGASTNSPSYNQSYASWNSSDGKVIASVYINASGNVETLSLYRTKVGQELDTLGQKIEDEISLVRSQYVSKTGDENIGGNKTFTNDVSVSGDLYVQGNCVVANVQNMEIEDNTITANAGELGAGISKSFAGIILDRGTCDNGWFGYHEDRFAPCVGWISFGIIPDETSDCILQKTVMVASMKDNPFVGGIAHWEGTSGSTLYFKTENDFKYLNNNLGIGDDDPQYKLSLAGSTSTNLISATNDNGTIKLNLENMINKLSSRNGADDAYKKMSIDFTGDINKNFYLASDGNYGFGKETPTSKIHVHDGSSNDLCLTLDKCNSNGNVIFDLNKNGDLIRLENSGGLFIYHNSDQYACFGNDSTKIGKADNGYLKVGTSGIYGCTETYACSHRNISKLATGSKFDNTVLHKIYFACDVGFSNGVCIYEEIISTDSQWGTNPDGCDYGCSPLRYSFKIKDVSPTNSITLNEIYKINNNSFSMCSSATFENDMNVSCGIFFVPDSGGFPKIDYSTGTGFIQNAQAGGSHVFSQGETSCEFVIGSTSIDFCNNSATNINGFESSGTSCIIIPSNNTSTKFKISNGTNGIEIGNSTGTGWQPLLDTLTVDSNDIGLWLRANITPANDTGSTDLFRIQARQNDGTDITTRPILNVYNNSTSLLKVQRDGKLDVCSDVTLGLQLACVGKGAINIISNTGCLSLDSNEIMACTDLYIQSGGNILFRPFTSGGDCVVMTQNCTIFNQDVGIGATSPRYRLHVAESNFLDVPAFVRTSTATNSQGSALKIMHETSDDMVDGFGVLLNFMIRDVSGATDNTIGSISAIRSGADNSGCVVISSYSTGTRNDAICINSDGTSNITQEDWEDATYLNSWITFSATGWYPAQYMKDSMGFVHLRGMVKNGTIGQPVFNLPSGYRPSGSLAEMFATPYNGGVGRIDVCSNGDVVIKDGVNSWRSLSGVSFYAG
jgi:hypothetical protein